MDDERESIEREFYESQVGGDKVGAWVGIILIAIALLSWLFSRPAAGADIQWKRVPVLRVDYRPGDVCEVRGAPPDLEKFGADWVDIVWGDRAGTIAAAQLLGEIKRDAQSGRLLFSCAGPTMRTACKVAWARYSARVP